MEKIPELVDVWSTIRDALSILERHQDIGNYEQLLSKLTRDERICLQRLLLIAFTDLSERKIEVDFGFANEPDGYDELIKRLGVSTPEWAIISLNYDLLLEEALRRSEVNLVYPHFPFYYGKNHHSDSALRVYKPHGSINFFAHGDFKFFHKEPPPDADRGRPTEFDFKENGDVTPRFPIVMAGMAGAENVLHVAQQGQTSFPVMANYTHGKDADVNDGTLGDVRREAMQVCHAAEEIIIVGVRPVLDGVDDPFISAALSIRFPKITYVSPSAGDCSTIKKAHPNATIYCVGLSDFLSAQRKS